MFANQRKTKFEGSVQKRQARDTAAQTQIDSNNKII